MITGLFSIPVEFEEYTLPQVWNVRNNPVIWELASRSTIWPLVARPTGWVLETANTGWILPKRNPTCLFEDSITITTALETEGTLIDITTENNRNIEEQGDAVKNRNTLAGCWILLERD